MTGAFAYGSDLWHERMLWGRDAPQSAPARVGSAAIDIAEGRPRSPASTRCSPTRTSEDQTYGLEFADQPVLADRVRYAGEPVAIVAAETPELAARAVELIEVDYEVLEAVTDMERGARAPTRRSSTSGATCFATSRIDHGDPDAEADVGSRATTRPGWQDQAPLGPEAGLAIPAEDGGIDLIVSTQWLHVDRQQIAPCLNLPEDKVRITSPASAARSASARTSTCRSTRACWRWHTGRPVKMSYGRVESFLAHVHRHPSRVWIRTGAAKDGRLVNVRARVLIDGGAFASSSPR